MAASTLTKGGGFPFKLLADTVAIKVNRVDKTPGGITLPDSIKQENMIETPSAVVLGVGPEVKYVKIGDIVYIAGPTPAMKAKIGEHEFLLIKEEMVGCIKA